MKKCHGKSISMHNINFIPNIHFQPSNNQIFTQNKNSFTKKPRPNKLVHVKSATTLQQRQISIEVRLKQVQFKIKVYKQNIELLQKTIFELDQLNAQLIQQAKQYSNKLQQFTYKTNKQIHQKNKMIERLQQQLKRYQFQTMSFSKNNFHAQSSKQIRQQAKRQEEIIRKQRQYQSLLIKYYNLEKEKNQQIAYYDKVIKEKQQTIIKMTEFNNELCMKLIDNKQKPKSIRNSQNFDNFDFRGNFKIMKNRLVDLMKEKQQLNKKIQSQSQRIHELEEIYLKNLQNIENLVKQVLCSGKRDNKKKSSLHKEQKDKSETSSSRSQDRNERQVFWSRKNKASSVDSLSNLLRSHFSFSQKMIKKHSPVFGKEQPYGNQSKNTLVQQLLYDNQSFSSNQ